MWRFLAVLRSFFPSCLMYFFLPFLSTNYSSILPHFIFLSISWSTSQSCCSQIHTQYSFGNSNSFCTCPNQRNLFKLTVSVVVGFLTIAYISLLVNILQFPFSLSYTGPKILLYTFLSKMLICFLSVLGSRFLMHMLTFVSYCVLAVLFLNFVNVNL